MSCCFIRNDTNIQIICNYSARIPYEFCVFGRKAVLHTRMATSISLIVSSVMAIYASFHGSRISNNAADEFSFAVVSFSGKDNQ